MNIKYDISAASHILRKEGPTAFFRALSRYIKRAPNQDSVATGHPDEADLAFQVLRAHTRKGVMIDVGAHFGGSMLPFLRMDWQIFAFEPDSENRRKLQQAFGNYENLTIDPRALSSKAEKDVIFYRSEQSTGISGLSAFHPSHQASDKVQVTTLTAFLEESGMLGTTIDFLKIDTEGFDLNVLKGIPWENTPPRLILCEFEDSKTIPLGYSYHDLAQFLQQKGYQLIISEWHPIKQYGTHHDWNRFTTYPADLENEKAWGNILAVKEDALFDDLLRICKI